MVFRASALLPFQAAAAGTGGVFADFNDLNGLFFQGGSVAFHVLNHTLGHPFPPDFIILTQPHRVQPSDDMRVFYSFTEQQNAALDELLTEEVRAMWNKLLYGSSGEIVAVALFQVGNVGGQPHWSWYSFNSRVENGVVYTVEGNSGDSCRQNTYSVGHYEIWGYAAPIYNYILKCFVLIDLKTGLLTHQDIGQM